MPRYRVRHEGGTDTIHDRSTHETWMPYAPIYFYDEFLGSGTAIPAAASAESGVPWVKKLVKTGGTVAAAITADSVGGIAELAIDDTDEKQEASIYFNDELQFSIQQGLVFEARIKATVLPTLGAEMVIGLVSAWADGPDAITYSAFFTLDGSGEVICEKDDNATDESLTSGMTLTNAEWAILRIDCSNVADIKFYVNGNRVAGGTTFDWAASAANSKVQPFLGVYKASTAGVGTLQCDYVRCWMNRE